MDENLNFLIATDVVCDIAREDLHRVGARHTRSGIGKTRKVVELVGTVIPDFRCDSGR